ncbi:hypothetical protein GALMADRAFT_276124 [Galerina marginata CBS 339.88]|uniref:G-protein coupled receptors family 1 profile domain-containing protein n=1 Tax=Galerina marginata (strain CBS 339.88) TaxID=685588 RepID=A0A067TW13_GALM3|nr:hypothetical protein GALMADRAFT_276124 [Galerina marginata CBS 339.88]
MSSAATPLFIHALANPDYKPALYGTVISAGAYGIVLAISGKCCRLLLQTKYIYSKRMQKFLFAYTIIMLLMSTGAMVEEILYIHSSIFCPPVLMNDDGMNIAHAAVLFFNEDSAFFLPLTVWGADGLMIWRCWVLYTGVSRLARVGLSFLLGILAFISLVGGVLYVLSPEIILSCVLVLTSKKSLAPIPALGILFTETPLRNLLFFTSNGLTDITIVLTAFVNIVLAGLIVSRILFHQRYLRQVLGNGHKSAYNRIMGIILFISLYYSGLPHLRHFLTVSSAARAARGFPLLVLPHVCVISPLLIIVRVSEGKALVDMPSGSQIHVPSLNFINASSGGEEAFPAAS